MFLNFYIIKAQKFQLEILSFFSDYSFNHAVPILICQKAFDSKPQQLHFLSLWYKNNEGYFIRSVLFTQQIRSTDAGVNITNTIPTKSNSFLPTQYT